MGDEGTLLASASIRNNRNLQKNLKICFFHQWVSERGSEATPLLAPMPSLPVKKRSSGELTIVTTVAKHVHVQGITHAALTLCTTACGKTLQLLQLFQQT